MRVGLALGRVLRGMRGGLPQRTEGVLVRLASGSAWSLAGGVVARLLNLVTAVLVARLLGKSDFGAFGFVQGTVLTVGSLAGFGLGATATKYVAELRESAPAQAAAVVRATSRLSAITAGLFGIALWLSAPAICAGWLANPALTPAVRIGGLWVALSAYGSAQAGTLLGFERFDAIALSGCVTAGVAIPASAFGAIWFGLNGAVGAATIAAAGACILNAVLVRREMVRSGMSAVGRGALNIAQILFGFSIPSLLSSALLTLSAWLLSAIMVRLPGGLAEMAVFSAASQWRNAALFIPGAVCAAAFPLLSNLAAEDAHGQRRVLRASFVVTATVALFIALGASVMSPLLMAAYGNGFRSGTLTLVVLVGSSVLIAVNNVIGVWLAARGQVWLGTIFCLALVVVQLATALVLAPRLGSLGAALAVLASYVVHTIWQGAYFLGATRKRALLKATARSRRVNAKSEPQRD